METLPGVLDGPHNVDHVYRQSDRPSVVAKTPRYGLANPPCGVGGELEPLAPVEFLNGADESEISLLYEVEKVQPATRVSLGD